MCEASGFACAYHPFRWNDGTGRGGEYAERKGLQAIAITDHDLVSAIDIAQKYAEKKQIEIVPGVEISTLWQKQEIHIFGYLIDVDDPALLSHWRTKGMFAIFAIR